MPTTYEPALAEPRGARRRWIVVAALAVVLAGGVSAALAWYHPIWRMWVHGATKDEYRKKLVEEQDPGIVPLIEDGLRDSDLSEDTRYALTDILIQKNRLMVVERALKDPKLDVRCVALERLARTTYFRKQYVTDDSFGVKTTLVEWLKDGGSRTRVKAVRIASSVFPPDGTASPEVLAAIRAMVAPNADGGGDAGLRASAALALAGWGDCESAAAILAWAKSDRMPEARLRSLQAVAQLFDTHSCGDRAPEAEVRAALESALAWPGEGNDNRSLRMGAIYILARHPEWARASADAIRARLTDPTANDAEHRSALDALWDIKDPQIVESFPRWFHQESPSLRSSAVSRVTSATGAAGAKYESCLVGFLRDEPGNSGASFAFQGAYAAIRARAGTWVGMPTTLARKGPQIVEMSDVLKPLFEKGEMVVKNEKGEEVKRTRAEIAETLWRWLAGRRGLAGEAIDAAAKSRDAFWEKAKAGDVSGAKAVLEPLLKENPDLWAYEEGWVLAKTSK